MPVVSQMYKWYLSPQPLEIDVCAAVFGRHPTRVRWCRVSCVLAAQECHTSIYNQKYYEVLLHFVLNGAS